MRLFVTILARRIIVIVILALGVALSVSVMQGRHQAAWHSWVVVASVVLIIVWMIASDLKRAKRRERLLSVGRPTPSGE